MHHYGSGRTGDAEHSPGGRPGAAKVDEGGPDRQPVPLAIPTLENYYVVLQPVALVRILPGRAGHPFSKAGKFPGGLEPGMLGLVGSKTGNGGLHGANESVSASTRYDKMS